MQIATSNSDATFAIGERLGRNCQGGELFVLSSDLGGGKTTFTKGLAKGLGSTDSVSSPTFTVSKVYKGKDLKLHHFDFYRLNEGGMVAHELAEFIDDPKSVVAVEWGDIIDDVLPKRRVTVRFERVASGEDDRQITIQCSEELIYILEGVQV